MSTHILFRMMDAKEDDILSSKPSSFGKLSRINGWTEHPLDSFLESNVNDFIVYQHSVLLHALS